MIKLFITIAIVDKSLIYWSSGLYNEFKMKGITFSTVNHHRQNFVIIIVYTNEVKN